MKSKVEADYKQDVRVIEAENALQGLLRLIRDHLTMLEIGKGNTWKNMDEMNPHMLLLPDVASCLSPSVRTLITERTFSDRRHTSALDVEGFLDFPSITNELPDAAVGDTVEYFEEAVKALAPVLHSVEEFVSQRCVTELLVIYRDMFIWTGQSQLLVEVWHMMDNNDDVDDLAVVLVITAVLERALGNVYLLTGSPPCPSMLRDLLLTPELDQAVGSHVIQVLRVLIGPPISLNLRNVAWHGFPVPGELPRRCIWFLLLLVPSIGKVLQSSNITVIEHRAPVKLAEVRPISDIQLAMCDCEELWRQVTLTRLVAWDTSQFWIKIRHHYDNRRLGVCAALLLMYIEHGLRRVFASVNQCPHRVLTAESTTLFTTFDEILSPFLPDNSTNSLRAVVGDSVLEILLDTLQYQDGPRVRDRLGHGEVDWFTFPVQLADRLVLLAVHLSAIFVPENRSVKVGVLQRIQADIGSYKVQFHRIAVIQSQVDECLTAAVTVDAGVRVLPDLTDREPGVVYPVTESHNQLECTQEQIVAMVISRWTLAASCGKSFSIVYHRGSELLQNVRDILSVKIPTLYRGSDSQSDAGVCPDREAEVLSLMQHVVTEVTMVIKQIKQFIRTREQQLVDKMLRSRQRDNLKRFLNSFPSYLTTTSLLLMLVAWQLYHLDNLKTLNDSSGRNRLRFWKTILQFCENLRTFTHIDRNKWTDGTDLMLRQMKTIESYVDKQLL